MWNYRQLEQINNNKEKTMATTCTRCEGSGFLNLHQIPNDFILSIEDNPNWLNLILSWIDENKDNDVSICDCCGDGESWHGVPGEHYNNEDPTGYNGPYAYNGGLCECH